MASGLQSSNSEPAAAYAFPDEMLPTLLAISLTAVNVLRPLYGPDGVNLTDFALDYLNPAAQRMAGLSGQPGGTLRQHLPEVFTNGTFDFYRRTFLSGKAGTFSLNYQADGLGNYFHLAARRCGEVLVVSFTDTADQPRTAVEEELRASQAREQAAYAEASRQRAQLLHVFEQAPAMICIFDGPTHVFQFVNPPYQALVGDRPLVGRPIAEAMPELAGQPIFGLLDRVYRTGEPFHANEMLVQLDHTNIGATELEKRYYNFIYQARRNPAGATDGILVFAYDVTPQVRVRQQVQELNAELEARVQARTAELETALRQTQQQRELLRHQQDTLQQIMQQVPAAIATLTGPDHRFTFFNEPYQALVDGRARLGQTAAEVFPEVREQGFIDLLDGVYQTGQAFVGSETPIELANSATGQNQQHYLDFVYQPLLDEHDQTTGILAFVVDVTTQVLARRQAEVLQAELLATAQRQAHEREAFYRIFEQAPALVALLRQPDHRFEYVNPAYQAFFPGQLVGQAVAEVAPELVAQGFGALLDHVYQTGETYHGAEVPFTPLPGPGERPQTRYFNFTYQAYWEDGAIGGVSIFAFDVTEQVQARQLREAEREHLHALFMEAPAPVVILDGPDLVYQLVNPAYQRIFPGRALLGKPLLEALPEMAGIPLLDELHRVYQTGETFVAQEMPVMLARHEGGALEEIYWTFTYQARRNAQGAVDGVLVFAHEVTDQVQARRVVEEGGQQARAMADKLAKSNQQLTRVNVDLDNFIYTASHDLKAPISNIEGLLYLLQDELPAAITQLEPVGPTLTRMLDAVERFKRTIDHLTDVSRLQKEHTPATTSVNLAAVVEDVRQDLAPLLQETGARLMVDVASLPPIQFSEKNLRSIVYNLLSNAVKYHSPARPPRVDVRGHVRSGHTVLEVHDNGLGIAPAHLPKLFTMFQRFHDHVDGSGVGLYMVKRMVENAGGRIEVHSQLGAGTTFFVHLPHATAPAA